MILYPINLLEKISRKKPEVKAIRIPVDFFVSSKIFQIIVKTKSILIEIYGILK